MLLTSKRETSCTAENSPSHVNNILLYLNTQKKSHAGTHGRREKENPCIIITTDTWKKTGQESCKDKICAIKWSHFFQGLAYALFHGVLNCIYCSYIYCYEICLRNAQYTLRSIFYMLYFLSCNTILPHKCVFLQEKIHVIRTYFLTTPT